MPKTKSFLIPVSMPVKSRGLYAIRSFGDVWVTFDTETFTIELIQYLGTDILALMTQIDPTLDYFYSAMESFLDAERTEKDIDLENNYEGAYN